MDQDLASSAVETVRDSPQDPNPEGHFEFCIILLGDDAAVGKSLLLHCFADRPWGGPGEGPDGAATPSPAVAVEFYSWTILMPPTGKVKLQLGHGWPGMAQVRWICGPQHPTDSSSCPGLFVNSQPGVQGQAVMAHRDSDVLGASDTLC